MKISISSLTDYKGFKLNEPLEFEAPYCIITGKNGVGKTRFLDSIIENRAQIFFDGDVLAPDKIGRTNVNIPNSSMLRSISYAYHIDLICRAILTTIENHVKGTEFPPETTSRSDFGEILTIPVLKLIREIEDISKKEIKKTTSNEIKLCLSLVNAVSQCLPSYKLNISILISKHYYEIEANNYLNYKVSNGDDLFCLDTHDFNKEKKSPHGVLNEIIRNSFDNKYHIQTPPKSCYDSIYKPSILRVDNDEQIEIENLSSGEKVILWMVLNIYAINTQHYENILDNKSLILLDEPDVYLHPKMIPELFKTLNSLNKMLNCNFILSTHSPTTVALLPNDELFVLEDFETNTIHRKVSKDEAIGNLLQGVSQISISPRNRRQVYVENGRDSDIYQAIFSKLSFKNLGLDPAITLTFMASGGQIPIDEIDKHVKSVFKDASEESLVLLTRKINEESDCNKVKRAVEYLENAGSETVRGIIDWDKSNKTAVSRKIIVAAKNYAYSIENLVFDPISIFAYLTTFHQNYHKKSDFCSCSDYDDLKDIIHDKDKLQEIIDSITNKVFNRKNDYKISIKYIVDKGLKGDTEFYNMRGHDLKSKILHAYPKLYELKSKKQTFQEIEYYLMTNITLEMLGFEFLSSEFLNTLIQLQK
ncbi:AAA family ATPase [Klebsiella sp. MPUS7]|uniref:AAA family ATPase n=1 Tax=Klebsiella sp. MPUS7 TaxID=2697371 RepID=UPI0013634F33|nr:AAA family ATPase [Klebsiella sp. MPUS7]QHI88668.1 AAA family ATPase [Klebsiella sp. MPUS7]